MKYLLLLLLPFMLTGEAAHAHNRDHHARPGHVIYTPWFLVQHRAPRRIRISENCVYKPYKNKTVCRY